MVQLNPETDWVDAPRFRTLRQLKESSLAAGRRIIDLSMINPDLPPPRLLLDRLVEATLQQKNHRYSVARGLAKLREGFAHLYRRQFSISVSADTQVCVTLGAKDAFLCSLAALCPRGTRVLLPKPTYAAYLSAIEFQGLIPLFYSVGTEEETLRSIELSVSAQPHIALCVCNFPHNPTGATVSSKFWQRLSEILKKDDTYIVNDFVYGELCFDGKPASSLLSCEALTGRALEIYSLSKAYSIPGWRLGAVVGDAAMVERVSRIKAHLDYGLFMPLQLAGAQALISNADLVSSARTQYAQRCGLLVKGLTQAGFSVSAPQAGCGVWAELPKEAGLAEAFCQELALQDGVFLLPGTNFGSEFERHVRIAAVAPDQILRDTLAACHRHCKSSISL
jgi:alanine-synthesizing transaminase